MHNTNKIHKNNFKSAFTIVELLIVIVIIGILAAITIVSYTGITQRANVATVQADLANASKKLKMYYALYGVYPYNMLADASGKYCPTGSTADNNYCIKPSSGIFTYSSSSPYTDFTLRVDSGNIAYVVTKDQAPTSLATTAITSISAITGTAQISQTLTAGTVTPAGATVSYQWQSATSANGSYSNIPGATASSYAVSPNVMGKYVRVTVTGTGSYGSSQVSAATAQIPTDSTNWLTIGSQTWARANLNVGTRIAGASAQTNNGGTNIVEKYCYSDTESNCTTYGGLYQWNEVMSYSTAEGTQGICPVGSHIPSDNDWKVLEIQLGMTQVQADGMGTRGIDQGIQLKSGGTSNFNALLSGFRNSAGSFGNLTFSGHFWSSTESDSSAWYRDISSSYSTINRTINGKDLGFSVRCLGN